MPRISTVVYSVRQGGKNLKRNRMFSLASIGTMAACLFLFGIFYFLLQNLQYAIRSAETNVGVTVFFEEGTDTGGDYKAAGGCLCKLCFGGGGVGALQRDESDGGAGGKLWGG